MGAGRRQHVVWLILLAAPAVWLGELVVHPSTFPYLPGSAYSDLLITHYPSAWFVHQAIARWHQLPLWNPNLLSGMPLAADPLAAIWYPPTWLTVLFPTAAGFNLLFYVHLVLAGVGMAAFVRRLGVDRGPAVFCGLAFGGLAKLVGHVGLGHVGMVAALGWLPWFMTLVDLAVRSSEARRARRRYALAAVSFALLLMADPRWALPAAALGLAWWLRCVVDARRAVHEELRSQLPRAALAALLAGMLCAPLLLPMAELVQHSTRSTLSPGEAAGLSLPPMRLLSLLDPAAAGTPEWQAYVGLAALFFAGVAVVLSAPGWKFWAVEAAFSLLWSLGSYTPVYRVLSQVVPGALALRVPARLLFLMAFGLIVLAGLGLQELAHRPRLQGSYRPIRLWGFALMVVALSVAGMLPTLLGGEAVRWMTLLGAVAIGALVQGVGRSTRLAAWMVVGACILQLLDVGSFNLQQLEARPASVVLAEGEALIEQVRELAGPDLRAFSPSYSLPQQTAPRFELGLAEGVHPLQLRTYRDFMAAATGFDSTVYSVTLPPFPSGDPAQDWSPQIDLTRLGLLSVGALASAFPLEGMQPASEADGVYVYGNPAARPRAWVEPQGGPSEAWSAVEAWAWTPNGITVTAQGPGRVVLSEIDYPGWSVAVDGEPAALETAYDVLRSTSIPAGTHQLAFEFEPRTVVLGLAVALCGLVLLCWMGWRK